MSCGKPLAVICPDCRTPVAPGAKFCHNCGRSLAQPTAEEPRSGDWSDLVSRYLPKEFAARLEAARPSHALEGERRVVTILFCDVKGSTAMAEQLDPEEWTEIMNQAFEYLIKPIYRYEGTVARLMGDAILAFFGAPVAHEDDPQRAALASLGIVEGIAPFCERLKREQGLDFNVRVGINTGLVVVGEVGSGLRVEYTAMGDAVNLAARMEQTAQPGTIQVSANTYKLTASFFEFEPLGGIEVKGKAEPVPAYRLIGRRKAAAPARGIEGLSSPLVGRNRELSRLQTCLEELMGGRGQVVSVIGEAGLGKSRLVAELTRGAAVTGLSWYEGRCLSYEASTPYLPFIGLLGNILDNHAGQSESAEGSRYEWIKSRIEGFFPEGSQEITPFIAMLLGVPPAGEDYEYIRYLVPPLLRGRIFQAVGKFIERLAAEKPTVLVFEDVHWIDATSLDLLEQLLPLTERVMLMIVALFRPRRQEPSWHFHEVASRDFAHRYTPFQLEPLDESDSRALVANLLHIENLSEKVRSLILKKAEGNPFFVEEVIRSLLDQKLVVREDSHWRATREIEDISMPDTLMGVITARLDRLDGSARRVLQIASVIGREFPYDALRELHGTPQGLDEALADLQRRELIREQSRIPDGVYLFKHTLTQESAYHSLLLSKRRELHRRMAEYLESSDLGRINEIARHFIEARQPGRALPYLVQAGDQAAQAYSASEASAYYRQALGILSKMAFSELARRAYEGIGRVLSLGNDANGAVENYQAMYRYGQTYGDIPMQVSALNKLSDVMAFQLGQFPKAEKSLADAERLARQHDDRAGLAEHFLVRCGMCTATADFDGAVHYLSEAVQIGRELELKEQLAFGLAHIANTMTFMTRFEDAWQAAQEGLQVSEEIGHREHKADILVEPVAFYHLRNGDLEAAYQAALAGVNIGEQIGSIYIQCLGSWMLGEIARMRGQYQEALHMYQRSVQAGTPMEQSMPMFLIMALSGLGSTYLAISAEFEGRVRELHDRALKLLEHPVGAMAGSVVWMELGLCLMELGDRQRAGEFFQKGLTIPTPQMLLQRPRLLVGAAMLALAQGDLAGAAVQVAQARLAIEASAMKNYCPMVELAEAQVLNARGKPEQALERLALAEGLAVEMGLRPLVLRVRLEAARALRQLGRSAEAEEKWRQARTTVDEIVALFEDEMLREKYVRYVTKQLERAKED